MQETINIACIIGYTFLYILIKTTGCSFKTYYLHFNSKYTFSVKKDSLFAAGSRYAIRNKLKTDIKNFIQLSIKFLLLILKKIFVKSQVFKHKGSLRNTKNIGRSFSDH